MAESENVKKNETVLSEEIADRSVNPIDINKKESESIDMNQLPNQDTAKKKIKKKKEKKK